MKSVRTVAVEILEKIENEGAFSNIVVGNFLEKSNLSTKDKALCSAIVYGVLTRKISLDYIISKFSKQSVSKTDKTVLLVLRVAIYQMVFMDKIPSFAAVNEAILTLKALKKFNAVGFVNAVLRKVANEETSLLPSGQAAEDLAVNYSVNPDFVNALIKNYGYEDALSFLKSSVESPKLYARVNTLLTTTNALIESLAVDGIKALPCEVENAICLENVDNITQTKAYKNGLFHVQDLSSQIAIKTLCPLENMRLLDICAAPGGKSFTAAQYMKNTGEIVSCDLYENRVNLINSGAARLKITNLTALVNDASEYNEKLGKFDRIICDVPCSGFGVIRRKPEIRYKKLDEFKDLPSLQYKILSNAIKYLSTDGILMYSTCTLRKTENERVVEKFVKDNPEYKLEYLNTLMPHKDNTDGFFICLIRR